MNPLYTEGEMLHQIKDNGAKYIIVDPQALVKVEILHVVNTNSILQAQSVANTLVGQVKEIIVLGQDSFDVLVQNDGKVRFPPPPPFFSLIYIL